MHMTGICEVVTGTDSVPAFSVAAFCGTVFFFCFCFPPPSATAAEFLLLLLLLLVCCCCSFAVAFVAVL